MAQSSLVVLVDFLFFPFAIKPSENPYIKKMGNRGIRAHCILGLNSPKMLANERCVWHWVSAYAEPIRVKNSSVDLSPKKNLRTWISVLYCRCDAWAIFLFATWFMDERIKTVDIIFAISMSGGILQRGCISICHVGAAKTAQRISCSTNDTLHNKPTIKVEKLN